MQHSDFDATWPLHSLETQKLQAELANEPETTAADSVSQRAATFECLEDLRRWSATIKCSSDHRELLSLREALAVLTSPPRPRHEDVRPLLSKWRVAQMQQGKRIPSAEIRDLEDNAIHVAGNVQAKLAHTHT